MLRRPKIMYPTVLKMLACLQVLLMKYLVVQLFGGVLLLSFFDPFNIVVKDSLFWVWFCSVNYSALISLMAKP